MRIECLAIVIPTLFTGLGARRLPVADGENIVIANNGEKNFVTKLVRLVEDKDLRERLGRNGNKLAREKLDWNVIFKGTCSPLYGDLLARRYERPVRGHR